MTSTPATHNGRLDFLDAVRGIAALSVALQHIGERLSPAFAAFTTHYLQLGQFGVTLFFLTSGFIIPRSIEQSRTLAQFWVRRVCRLYPLYIFSMTAAVALFYAGSYHLMPATFANAPVSTILFNLTMLQDFLGRGNIVPLYWTLNFEMVFYVMVSALLTVGLLKRSAQLASAWLTLSILAGLAIPTLLHSYAGNGLFFNFATMFVGTVVYRGYQGRASRSVVAAVMGLALTAVLVINWSYFHGHDDPTFLGARSFIPMTTAWAGAYSLFLVSFALRSRPVPRVLRFLGTISYSVYLMQTFVLTLAPPLGAAWLSAIMWLLLLVTLSSVTYKLVEEPFIRLGRATRLGGVRAPSVPPVLEGAAAD